MVPTWSAEDESICDVEVSVGQCRMSCVTVWPLATAAAYRRSTSPLTGGSVHFWRYSGHDRLIDVGTQLLASSGRYDQL